jgi:hypothetical protein
LEDRLHALVISGKLDLKTAQREIATDWIAAYKKYIGPSPISGHRLDYARAGANGSAPPDSRSEAPISTESATAKVWVNTSSGKYFRPGQQWYGRTKRGEYMSEAEAIRKGIGLRTEDRITVKLQADPDVGSIFSAILVGLAANRRRLLALRRRRPVTLVQGAVTCFDYLAANPFMQL